jgi:hypothetical protein
LAIYCGINFPFLEYQHLVSGKLPEQTEYSKEVFWIDSIPDLTRIIRFIRRDRLSLNDCFRPYISEHVYAVFNWKDLKPFFKRVFDIAKIIIFKLIGNSE